MKCANCQSENTVKSDSGKLLFCLACEASTEVKGQEQHAGGKNLGAQILDEVKAINSRVGVLEGRLGDGVAVPEDPPEEQPADPPADPPAPEEEDYFGEG